MTERQNQLVSLHKYWMYSNRMAMLFKGTRGEMSKTLENSDFQSMPPFLKIQSVFLSDFGIFKAFWYGSLYVVIEGYKDLKLISKNVDQLMNNDFIDKLRLFRNATFHYQKDNYSEKLFKVDKSDEFTNWIYKFHDVIGKSIVKEMSKELGDEKSEVIFTLLREINGYDFQTSIFQNDRKTSLNKK